VEQDFQVPLPVGEGFRVRAVRSLAKVTYSQSLVLIEWGNRLPLLTRPTYFLFFKMLKNNSYLLKKILLSSYFRLGSYLRKNAIGMALFL
jgi:hypothetical protein